MYIFIFFLFFFLSETLSRRYHTAFCAMRIKKCLYSSHEFETLRELIVMMNVNLEKHDYVLCTILYSCREINYIF